MAAESVALARPEAHRGRLVRAQDTRRSARLGVFAAARRAVEGYAEGVAAR